MKKVTFKRLANEEWPHEIMASILELPTNGQGVTVDEMEQMIPLIKKLRAVEKVDVGVSELYLEDAEHKALVERITTYNGWARNTEEIYDMIKAVENAPDVQFDGVALGGDAAVT